MKMTRFLLLAIGLLFLQNFCRAQKADTIPAYIQGKQPAPVRLSDTLPRMDSALRRRHHTDSPYKVDSLARHTHDPRRATLYSTFFPGLGQIYNRKYWKVPIVWGAVGIPAYLYFDNRNWYRKCQFAISVIDTYLPLGKPVPADSLKMVDPKLQPFVTNNDDNSLRSYRNQYRKNQDYSVLFFILFWGLNIVDATVDAHLMSFDVGNELSFRLNQPSGDAMVRGPMGPGMGLSLLVDFHKPRYKTLSMLP